MEETRNTATNNATENEKIKKIDYQINIGKHATFDVVMETTITTSRDLSVLVNQVFENTFDDYIGCVLTPINTPNMGYTLIPYLYFKLYQKDFYDECEKEEIVTVTNKEGKEEKVRVPKKICAFKPAITSNSSFLERRLNMTNPNREAAMVTMTDEAKSALAQFIPYNNKINWKDLYTVKCEPSETVIALRGLNVTKIVEKVYGKFDKDGGFVEYQVSPIKEITNTNQMALGLPGNWAVKIDRINDDANIKAAQSLGMYYTGSANGAIPMVRINQK